jgi:PTS system nitrogen regulatory IIA component
MRDSVHDFSMDMVLPDLNVSGKSGLFKALGEEVSKVTGVDKEAFIKDLWMEDSLVSSGIGGGVAIHHTKSANLTDSFSVFVRLKEPIEYGTVDGEPVDLVCVVVSPSDDKLSNLLRISRISRMFGKFSYRTMLRRAKSVEEMRSILMNIKKQMSASVLSSVSAREAVVSSPFTELSSHRQSGA